ncbi:MAG: hypothetical protein QFB86_01370 [Patescibacteria group bacterium]|nr:hypothetical protein [Patescibacteria group bacterium]
MSKIEVHSPGEHTSKSRNFLVAAWLLSATTVAISIAAWTKNYGGHFFPIMNYQLFPLLGLMAFGLMWAHYMVGTFSNIFEVPGRTFKRYFQYTGYAVLALICLHPGLLIFQRFRDGYGLPPQSYESYVAPGLGWVTLLGTVSFLIFIAYEFRRVFSQKSWWYLIPAAGDFAMLAILYHGLRLGGELRMEGWFRVVWLFYAASLVAVLARSYLLKYQKRQLAA